jgi:mono/diheme cytochrome c family protein
MKKIFYTSSAMLVLTLSYGGNIDEGKKLFENKCLTCHASTRPTTPEAMNSLIAPPIQGIMLHMNMNFENDKKAMVVFLKDYVMNPSREKALCMPQKIDRFGLMPSLKGTVSPEELDKIAKYLSVTYY